MLLPSGTCITLAAYDHSSSDPIVSELTTVAFGQFDGLALKNSLVVTFVKRSQPTSTWPSASACDAAVPDAKYQQVQAYMRVRWCATLRTWTQSNEASLVSAELASRISKSVAILGATSEEHKTISEVYVSERGPSYIRYVMLRTADTLNLLVARPVGPSDIKFPSAADPETQRRVANLAHFSYHASLALRREYPALDLSEDSPKDETQIENTIGRAE